MKLAAKGMVDVGYHAYGRKWPRDTQIEVDVSADEAKLILADRHIVAVVIPEVQERPQAKAR